MMRKEKMEENNGGHWETYQTTQNHTFGTPGFSNLRAPGAVTWVPFPPTISNPPFYTGQNPGIAFPTFLSPAWSGEPLEKTGIRAGEIIAYRLWRVRFLCGIPCLYSMALDHVCWYPGKSVNIEDAGVPGAIKDYPGQGWGWGIHGFKSYAMADKYRASWAEPKTIVTGEVFLWGDVIEHVDGYRAEYGAIKSLNQIYSTNRSVKEQQEIMAKLQKIYFLEKNR